jgi:hypothetical protein
MSIVTTGEPANMYTKQEMWGVSVDGFAKHFNGITFKLIKMNVINI